MKQRILLITGILTSLIVIAGCGRTAPAAPSVLSDPRVGTTQSVSVSNAAQTASGLTPSLSDSNPVGGEMTPMRFVETRTGRIARQTTVYAEPGSQATRLGDLDANELVVVTGEQNGWYQAIYPSGPGGHGWLPADTVTFAVGWQTTLPPASSARSVNQEPGATPTPISPAVEMADGPTSSANRPAPSTDVAGADRANVHAEPDTPELSGRLVFQTSSGGAIYLLDLGANTLEYLTYGLDPALSPDGKQVAFTRWDDPRGLYVLDVESGEIRRLVGDNLIKNPTWSPDGTQLIFSQQIGGSGAQTITHPRFGEFTIPADPHWRLQVINANGTGLEGVDDQMHSFNPSWSGYGVLYTDGGRIYVTEPGGETWLLYEGSNTVRNPSWSPDGNYIVATMAFHDHWEIVRLNADGSGLVRLTKSYNGVQSVSPTWSSDGSHIVYLTDRSGGWKLWVMDSDGAQQTQLSTGLLAEITFRYDFNAEHVVDWR